MHSKFCAGFPQSIIHLQWYCLDLKLAVLRCSGALLTPADSGRALGGSAWFPQESPPRPKADAPLQPSSSAVYPHPAPSSRRTAPARGLSTTPSAGTTPRLPRPSLQTRWRRRRPHAQGLPLLPISRQPIRARRGPRPRQKRGKA